MSSLRASTFRSHRGSWIGLLGLFLALPLAFVSLAAAGCLVAIVTVSVIVLQERRLARLVSDHETLSAEIGTLSTLLLNVESFAKTTARQAAEAPPPPSAEPVDTTSVMNGLEEVSSEIGLLSGIVRELAAVVATQNTEIVALKTSVSSVREAQAVPVVAARIEEVRPGPSVRPNIVVALSSSAPSAPIAAPKARLDETALVEAFDNGSLEIFLQPIVSLPQRKVVSYEGLARLKLGEDRIAPEDFLPVLERHGRTTALDRRMLDAVAMIARHLQRRGSPASVAYSLSPQSLYEPGFLRSLGTLLGEEHDVHGRVVIALSQANWRNLDREQQSALAKIRDRFGFALDRPTDLGFEAAFLAGHGVGQIKVPASLLLEPASRQSAPDIAVEDLVAALGRSGIRMIATEVERESDVPDLIDLDLPLAQGTVFAGPKPVRSEVFALAPDPKPETAEPVGAEAGRRRPFRDFLRRAV